MQLSAKRKLSLTPDTYVRNQKRKLQGFFETASPRQLFSDENQETEKSCQTPPPKVRNQEEKYDRVNTIKEIKKDKAWEMRQERDSESTCFFRSLQVGALLVRSLNELQPEGTFSNAAPPCTP